MALIKVEKKFDRHYEGKCADDVVKALERQYGALVLFSEDRRGGDFEEQFTHRRVALHSPGAGFYLKFMNQALKGKWINDLRSDVTSRIYWGVHAIVGVPDTPTGVNALGTIETVLDTHRASPARVWGYQQGEIVFNNQAELDTAYAEHLAKTKPSP